MPYQRGQQPTDLRDGQWQQLGHFCAQRPPIVRHGDRLDGGGAHDRKEGVGQHRQGDVPIPGGGGPGSGQARSRPWPAGSCIPPSSAPRPLDQLGQGRPCRPIAHIEGQLPIDQAAADQQPMAPTSALAVAGSAPWLRRRPAGPWPIPRYELPPGPSRHLPSKPCRHALGAGHRPQRLAALDRQHVGHAPPTSGAVVRHRHRPRRRSPRRPGSRPPALAPACPEPAAAWCRSRPHRGWQPPGSAPDPQPALGQTRSISVPVAAGIGRNTPPGSSRSARPSPSTAAAPTDLVPFLRNPVSSTTSTASGSPVLYDIAA